MKDVTQILICIDDTDDLTKKTSTGSIAQLIAKELQKKGGKLIKGISRHQLLLHEEIAYTSHNSSMCMVIEFERCDLCEIRFCTERILREHMAETANPGVAICCPEELRIPEKLIEFGFLAKQQVLTTKDAYMTAQNTGGIFLKELGGDGTGVIGALAGLGLRLSNCDGTLRGKKGLGLKGKIIPAQEMCRLLGIEQIVDEKGQQVPETAMTTINEFAKITFVKGKLSAIAKQNKDTIYEISSKHQEREKLNNCMNYIKSCPFFELDNDEEECITTNVKECFNCLFRRWTNSGFVCKKRT